jgi:cytochrome P450
MCIGRDFAMLVARLVLAGIARRYALRGLPGREPEPQALISLRTRHGMPMTLQPVQ